MKAMYGRCVTGHVDSTLSVMGTNVYIILTTLNPRDHVNRAGPCAAGVVTVTTTCKSRLYLLTQASTASPATRLIRPFLVHTRGAMLCRTLFCFSPKFNPFRLLRQPVHKDTVSADKFRSVPHSQTRKYSPGPVARQPQLTMECRRSQITQSRYLLELRGTNDNTWLLALPQYTWLSL